MSGFAHDLLGTKTGEGLSFHSLRHSLASDLKVSGVSWASLSRSWGVAPGRSPSICTGPMRAAAIMSLIQSARMNGHDPYAYLKDVLSRLPMQRASEIDQLLPHQGGRL